MDISMHFHSQMIFSGAVFVYFLKNKSDTTLVTKKFLTDSAPYGRVKCGRSDNGTEYMSDAFQSLMREKGIRHETSSSILSSSKWYSRETVENPFWNGKMSLIREGITKRIVALSCTTCLSCPKQIQWQDQKYTIFHVNRKITKSVENVGVLIRVLYLQTWS